MEGEKIKLYLCVAAKVQETNESSKNLHDTVVLSQFKETYETL